MAKQNNPEKIVEIREQQLQQYLKFLKTKKWSDSLKNDHGVRNNVVVGNISVGKSSLLNHFFGLNLKVGVDETTLAAEPVRKGKIVVWDSPGINEDFDLYNVNTLTLFGTADKIFILFNTSLRSCKNDVRILSTIKPHATFCIRTQCDEFPNDNELQNALGKDRTLLN